MVFHSSGSKKSIQREEKETREKDKVDIPAAFGLQTPPVVRKGRYTLLPFQCF